MRKIVVTMIVLFWVGFSSSSIAAVEKSLFDRYQVIIDRSPFGKTDLNSVSAVASNFLARYAFVGVIGSPDTGLSAALVDKQTNQSYFKTAGESMGDITIVRIEDSLPKRKLILRRGLEVGSLIFGENAPLAMAAAAPATTTPTPTEPAASLNNVPRRRTPFIR